MLYKVCFQTLVILGSEISKTTNSREAYIGLYHTIINSTHHHLSSWSIFLWVQHTSVVEEP